MNTIDIISIHNNLTKQYNNEKNFNFYLIRALPLLEKYREINSSRNKISFMGSVSKKEKDHSLLNSTIREFFKLVEEYFPNDLKTYDYTKISEESKNPFVQETRKNSSCLHCNNENDQFSLCDNHYVCEKCGYVTENTQNNMSYKDIDRVNISSKYTYDRRVHFRDCINQFQGKQNASIDQKVYNDLIEQFLLHDLIPANYKDIPKEIAFAKITKEHVMLFLKETKHSKHYEDIVLIHATLTGKPTPDISHLENILLHDFDILTDVYDKKYKSIERKNFINTQYVLYQLLRRHKYPCKKEDFNILKTVDRKYYHDSLCTELFQQLGWNLHPLF